jgi:tetratricopeptide (TPR) repeat protein
MTRRSFTAAAIFLFIALELSWGQGGRMRPASPSPRQIRGTVVDDSGVALENVVVELEWDGGVGVISTTRTDAIGKFVFEQVNAGKYTLRINYPRFREVVQPIDVSTSFSSYSNFNLQPLNPVKTIVIQATPVEAQEQLQIGREKLEMGRPEEAIAEFDKALRVHPGYADAYFWKGTVLMDLGKFQEAQAALQKAIELNPTFGIAYLALGACFNRMNNFSAAEQPLLEVVKISPDAMEAHYELARTYFSLNRGMEAEKFARSAIQLKTDFAPAHVVLGNVLLRKKDTQGALTAFKEYLRLQPSGPMAAGVRGMVAKLESQPN